METLILPAARLYAALAGLVAVFHLAVILGAPFGTVTMGGRWPGRLPVAARALSAASGALVLWTATVWVGAAGLGPTPPAALAEWLAFGISVLALVANGSTPSKAERRLWLPVSAVMLVAASIVVFRS